MFKIGDEIECIKEEHYTWIAIGDRMIVREVIPEKDLKGTNKWNLRVVSKDGFKSRWCNSNNFKLVKN